MVRTSIAHARASANAATARIAACSTHSTRNKLIAAALSAAMAGAAFGLAGCTAEMSYDLGVKSAKLKGKRISNKAAVKRAGKLVVTDKAGNKLTATIKLK
ncbi:MAG: hypothetical protein ACI36W_05730 [Coriobacteriales bacterium]